MGAEATSLAALAQTLTTPFKTNQTYINETNNKMTAASTDP